MLLPKEKAIFIPNITKGINAVQGVETQMFQNWYKCSLIAKSKINR